MLRQAALECLHKSDFDLIIIAVILGVLLRVVAHFMPGDTTPPSSDMKLNDVRSKATMDRL